MTLSGDKRLTGLNILVTRPVYQSAFLAESIHALGGNAIVFPVLEIADVADPAPLLELISRLDQFDWAVFVSPNAVNKALDLLTARRAIPASLRIAAVGKGSAAALKRYGIDNVLVPEENFDSEALLEQRELQDMAGKHVVIFRGNGGRQLLGDTLRQRGATVEYAECYIRKKPEIDTAPLLAAWSQGQLHAVIITSSEGLHNLFDIIGELGQQLLKKTPVFTIHERIAQAAKELGVEKVIRASAAGDAGLLESIQEYFQKT